MSPLTRVWAEMSYNCPAGPLDAVSNIVNRQKWGAGAPFGMLWGKGCTGQMAGEE